MATLSNKKELLSHEGLVVVDLIQVSKQDFQSPSTALAL